MNSFGENGFPGRLGNWNARDGASEWCGLCVCVCVVLCVNVVGSVVGGIL